MPRPCNAPSFMSVIRPDTRSPSLSTPPALSFTQMRRAALLAVAVLAGCGPAATHPTATPKTVAAFTGPHSKVDSEEEYTSTRSDYDALPLDAPARPGARA